MLQSFYYPPKTIIQSHNVNDTNINKIDNILVFQIIFMKILVLITTVILPLLIDQDKACFVLTLLIALQFWTNKNLARVFLKAHWFVDTTTEKDRWVFEAGLKSPDAFQGFFWYSSFCYMIVLLVCLVYYVSKNSMSLYCSVFIGLVCGYLNFFAYSKIIKARNQGLLQKIHRDTDENKQIDRNKATVQIPLITVKSELRQIAEEEESHVFYEV